MENSSLELSRMLLNITFPGDEFFGFFPAPDGQILFLKKDSKDIGIITGKGEVIKPDGRYKLNSFSFSSEVVSDYQNFRPYIKKILFLKDKTACIGRFQEGGVVFFDGEGKLIRDLANDLRSCVGFDDPFVGAAVLDDEHLFCFGDVFFQLHKYNNVFINGRHNLVTPNIIKDRSIVEVVSLRDGRIFAVVSNQVGKTEIMILNWAISGLVDQDASGLFQVLAPAIDTKASSMISVCPEGLIFCKIKSDYFGKYENPGLVAFNRDLSLNVQIMEKLEYINIHSGDKARILPSDSISHLFGRRFLVYGPKSSLRLFNFESDSRRPFQVLEIPHIFKEEFFKGEIKFVHFMPDVGKTMLVFQGEEETKFFWANIH